MPYGYLNDQEAELDGLPICEACQHTIHIGDVCDADRGDKGDCPCAYNRNGVLAQMAQDAAFRLHSTAGDAIPRCGGCGECNGCIGAY